MVRSYMSPFRKKKRVLRSHNGYGSVLRLFRNNSERALLSDSEQTTISSGFLGFFKSKKKNCPACVYSAVYGSGHPHHPKREMASRLRPLRAVLLPVVGVLSGGVVSSRFSRPREEVSCDDSGGRGGAATAAAAGEQRDAAEPETLSSNLVNQLEGKHDGGVVFTVLLELYCCMERYIHTYAVVLRIYIYYCCTAFSLGTTWDALLYRLLLCNTRGLAAGLSR